MDDESSQQDAKASTCDWSRAATESAASATAALEALGINGGSNRISAGTATPLSVEKPVTSDAASSRYFGETNNNNNNSVVPVRRIQSDIQKPSNSNLSDAIDDAVRPTKSMDQAITRKKLDKYGFIINMDDQGNLFDETSHERIPTFAEAKTTERREQKWNSMLNSWERKNKRRRKLLRRLRKGVPDSLRGKVWCQLGNVPKRIKEKKGYYDQLVLESTRVLPEGTENDLDNTNMEEPDATDILPAKSFRATQETIERDIHRTFPRHHLFHEDSTAEDDSDDDMLPALCDAEVSSWISQLERHSGEKSALSDKKINPAIARGGQASLRRVLRSYSVHDSEVGYCQGMNFIAAMFLTFMSEEEAFWLLVAVMNDPPGRMRGMFGKEMQAAHQILYVAEKLLSRFLPRLAKHLEKENIHITMYGTQWFLTLYTSSFRFDLVTRVWDCFLAEGWKVVYRVMLALMSQSSSVLMTLSFEEILAYFRDLPERVSGESVMETALKIPLKRRHIVKYEKEWLANNPQ